MHLWSNFQEREPSSTARLMKRAQISKGSAAGVYNQVEIELGLPVALRNKILKPAHVRYLGSQTNPAPHGDISAVRLALQFDPMTKSRIIEAIHGALRPGCCPFLGGSEVSMPIGNGFPRVLASEATFFKSV